MKFSVLAVCLMIGSVWGQSSPNEPKQSDSWTASGRLAISACYRRANGLCQTTPLTDAEKDADEVYIEFTKLWTVTSLKEFRAELRKLMDTDEPMVVPAVQTVRYEFGDSPEWAEWAAACKRNGRSWVDGKGCRYRDWSCADGNRVLSHSDNGKLHVCLKLPESK